MRLRFPELFEECGTTAYQVAKASGGRLNLAALYRLVARRGRVRYVDAELVETLCDLLGVELGDVLEREPIAPARAAKRPRRQRRPRRGA